MATALDLLIAIKARDEASAELKKVEGSISGLGGAALSVGKVLATGLAVGAAAVAAGLGASANAAAGFEQTMSGVKAVSGATADQMTQLSQKALELGKATVFSASEAGQGIEELVKGGISIDDVMGGAAEATLSLASAGGVDLVTAATIASNALNGFNLKGADMAHVSDLIAGAANASAIDVNEFGLALSQSAAVASTVGLTFDDLSVAIAEMGNAGIKGSDAGTSLKTMFLNLSPTTKQATTEMKALGIITADGANQFFDATGKAKGMADISQVLQNATKNLSEEQRLQALQMLFGTDAIRAAAVMAKNGAEGFDTLSASMSKVSAESVAAERLNNLKGDLEQLKGSVETAAITLGTALLPALREAAQGATGFVNGLIPLIERNGPMLVAMLQNAGGAILTFAGQLSSGAANALQGIADKLAETGAAWAPWAAQAGPAGDAVSKTLSGVSGVIQALQLGLQGNFSAAWATATAAMGSFATPADLLRAAINAIQLQFAAFTPTGERVGAAFDVIGTAVAGLISTGQSLATQFSDSGAAAAASSGAFDALVTSVNAASAGIAGVTKFIQDNVVVQALLVAGLTAAATIWGLMTAAAIAHTVATNAVAIATGVYTAAQWLLNAALTANPIGIIVVALAALAAGLIYAYNNSEEFRAVVDAAFAAVLVAGKALLEFVKMLPGLIQNALATAGAAFSAFGTNVQTALATIGGFFSNIGTQIQAGLAAVGSFFSGIGADVRTGLDAVGSAVGGFFSTLGTTVKSGLDAIAMFFSKMWNAVPEDIRADLAAVITLIGDHFSQLGSMVQAGMAMVGDAFAAGWAAATNAVGGAMAAIGTAVSEGWTAVTSAVATAMAAVGAAVSAGWDAVSTAVGGAMSALGTTVQAGWDAISAVVGAVLGTIARDVQTGWDTITTAAAAAWNGISSAIGAALDTAIGVVTGWIADILGKFTGLGAEMSRAGAAAGQAVIDGLTGAIGSGIRAVGDKALELVRGTLAAAKAGLGAQSPSKEFAKLGVNIGEGLIQGMESQRDAVNAAMANTIRSAVSGLKGGTGGFLTIPQFGSAIKALGFNAEAISAICGPIAAQGISEGLGKSVSLVDVESIASKIGAYSRGAGVFGTAAFEKILSAIGIDSRTASFQEAVDAAMKGIPVAISTPLHYFLAQGFDSATQQFIVGNTGTALKRGTEKMTAAAIEGVAGAATYIIPSLQVAGAAVSDLADSIATGFVGVATPAVFDLEQAITDLVGTNDLWQQMDANASATGRDLATFLGDTGAAGIDLATASLEDLQAASGLTLPQVQDAAQAAGEDIQQWLMDVGVPAAQGLSDALQSLQTEGIPAVESTGISLQQLGRDIEASFTAAAPTAVDKFYGLLTKLATDVDVEGNVIATKMADIATTVSTGIAKATADGAKQISDAMRAAQDQLDQLGGSRADTSSVAVKQTGLEAQIAAAKALRAQQRTDADALYAHQQDLAKASATLTKDLATAQKETDRARITDSYNTMVAGLNTAYTQRVADTARTRGLDAADRAFAVAEDAKLTEFKQTAIIAQRDAKILAAQQATAGTITAAQDSADQERAVLAKSYVAKLADLKSGLLAQLPGLTGEAANVVQRVLDQVALESAGVTATITGDLGALANVVATTLVKQYGISFAQASAIVADHGEALHRVLGVNGEIPKDIAVSDTAVEGFADTFKITWPEARRILENAGAVATQVLGVNGTIPTAAQQTVNAVGGVSQANKELIAPIGNAKTALSNLAEDGFGVAQKAADVLHEQFPGFFDAFKAQFPELSTAIDGLIADLGQIPTEITTTITTEFAQSGIAEGTNRNAPSGGGGGGGNIGHDSSAVDTSQAALSNQSNRADLRNQGYQVGQNPDGTFYAEKRAVGGPVRGGVPYFVGEHGPELFVPQQSGSISANGMGGGIDYGQLASAVARAIQGMPAPRVAVEDVRSSLIRIGQRNSGFVGLA